MERYSDLTVGDFWGIGKKSLSLDDDKGTSLLIINTRKGQHLFDSIKQQIQFTECKIEDIQGGNMCMNQSAQKGELRKLFFKDLGKKSFIYIYYRYVVIRKIYTMLRKLKGVGGLLKSF